MHTAVGAQYAALAVDHRAFAQRVRGLAFDERRVVAVGHEANLLAVGLRGHPQFQPVRVRPHGVLVKVTHGERRAR